MKPIGDGDHRHSGGQDRTSWVWVGAAVLFAVPMLFGEPMKGTLRKKNQRKKLTSLLGTVRLQAAGLTCGQALTGDDKKDYYRMKAHNLAAATRCVQFVLLRLYRRIQGGGAFEAFARTHRSFSPELQEQIKSFFNMPVLQSKQSDSERMAYLLSPAMVSELDDPESRIVARNWMKGNLGYEVCLQSKKAFKLNKVEHVVGVLLHEIVHSMHKEHEPHAKHGDDFNVMNDFLVGFARCQLRGAPPSEKQKWRAWHGVVDGVANKFVCAQFDEDEFESSCESGTVAFCGMHVSIGACSARCASRGDPTKDEN